HIQPPGHGIDLRCQPLTGGLIQISDHHFGAFCGQPAGDAGANAPGTTGHQHATTTETHHAQRPVKTGLRFSITAASPSRESAVPESSETVRLSSGKQASTPSPTPFHTMR